MKKIIVFGAAALLAVLVIILLVRGDQPEPVPEQQPTSAATAALSHRIDVPFLSQVGEYPCGCESVSAVMALRYAGYGDMDADTFIQEYLPQSSEPYYGDDGLLYAESPYESFIGSPYYDYSYGCYAPVIKKAMESVVKDAGAINAAPGEATGTPRVIDLTGKTLEELCSDYIDRDIPVIVWGTIGMQPISGLTEWILPDGEVFTWKSQEHCLLLVGYDEACYYFNDPIEGKDTAYPKANVQNAYAELYSQALTIEKNE